MSNMFRTIRHVLDELNIPNEFPSAARRYGDHCLD